MPPPPITVTPLTMPRKEFQRDLTQASVPGRFPHLKGVRAGEEHGSVLFTYTVPCSTQTIDFQTSILDTDDYPGHHTYFTFAASDNVPDDVSKAIERLQPAFAGLAIEPFLKCISDSIDDALLGVDSALDLLHENRSESEIFSGDDMDFDVDSVDTDAQFTPPTDQAEVMKQIRSDMSAVKKAGYRVAVLGQLTGCLIISISCRIAKLGISKVAMQAWNVRPSQYLVLLLRYPFGYRNLDQVISKSIPKTPLIQMHVGLCGSSKPSFTAATQAFVSTEAEVPGNTKNVGPELQSFFIGDSLHTLLNTHLIELVRHRLQHGFTWTGAELYLRNSQGRIQDSEEVAREVYFVPEAWNDATPRFLRADHISEEKAPLSLPLIAIQFILRRFVKCTEFCLNCYCKVDAGFEALMPYVCSNSLCLYQYMRLGMGPRLEWEIISQPYVVDMLVSFTYARAVSGYLEDFPVGLGMNAPTYYATESDQMVYHGLLNKATMVLDVHETPDLRVGDWIAIVPCGAHIRHGRPQWHCRVQNANSPSYIQLTPPICREIPDEHGINMKGSDEVQFVRYKACFDDLPDSAKCDAIVMLLETLPDINSMRSFILSHPNGNSKRMLASWCDKISPAALYALRWIVASNRSCIRYEDDPEHKIPHMNGYAQFRLAQGAPDKEQRFVSAVKSLSSSHNAEYPTLFAWHGSPISNWHSILREGLHFKRVSNGRSSGNGVYMSPQFRYSVSFASSQHVARTWPNSILNIDKALSLNEVVNAPEQFVYNGRYYVVDKLDWIQPRYLIIGHKSASLMVGDARLVPSITYTQHPDHQALGPDNLALMLPISAVSSHWSQRYAETTRSTYEGQLSQNVALISDDDRDSVATLADDDWLLDADAITSTGTDDEVANEACHDLSKTDFRPGSLKESVLQLLGPPKYATTLATKSLQRHLQATLKVQERESLHALGWYIDPALVNNVYQWIVQLHSFEPTLPLAKDMKAVGLTAIVMELRFPPQFPMSPPFVRIIRPRFLPFSQGGGGHVTAGGAMCMELLTSSGWSPVSSIESVLLQVRMALTSTDPVPARLEQRRTQDYSVGEAVAAYTRVCQLHGWTVPDDLREVSW